MKQVLIAGLGKSGRGAAALLLQNYPQIKLYLYDQGESRAEPPFFGLITDQNAPQFFESNPPDLVVLNPAISLDNPTIKLALSLGIEVIGEIELGSLFCPAEIIAVTGTNGKSTTTALISQIMTDAGKRCPSLGNIGVSFASGVRDLKEEDFVSLEVSSFQLETIKRFRPKVAMVLNIAPDHLDRHNSLENYARIKLSIAKNQSHSDYLILNADDIEIDFLEGGCFVPDVYFVSTKRPIRGAYVDNEGFMCFEGIRVLRANELGLLGEHNVSNALFAIAATMLLGVDVESMAKTLKNFGGIKHRLQFLGQRGGQLFYNDSKATNTISALTAFRALRGTTAVIMGGSDKGEDFDFLFERLPKNIEFIALMGATAPKLHMSAKKFGFENVVVCQSLKSALTAAINSHCQNVLLSPSCASFDMFANYEHRGDIFIGLVESYLNSD